MAGVGISLKLHDYNDGMEQTINATFLSVCLQNQADGKVTFAILRIKLNT